MLSRYLSILSANYHVLLVKVFPIIFLVIIYIYLFGIISVERFMEGSIVTISKSLDISSADMEINPGLPKK